MNVFKTCGCGVTYSKEEWVALKYIGTQKTEDETHVFFLEMRNCAKCNSTIGVEVSYPKSESDYSCGYCGVNALPIPYEEMYGPGAIGWPCCPSCGGV